MAKTKMPRGRSSPSLFATHAPRNFPLSRKDDSPDIAGTGFWPKSVRSVESALSMRKPEFKLQRPDWI